MLRGYHTLRDLLAQPALAGVTGPIRRPASDFADDDEVMAHIRATAATAYHPTGTCRMGADENSVVDGELCVRGVDGLRIADASVFPRLPGGNTNLPVIMVAERAAEFVAKGRR
jgi:choline dehydrogenase